MRKKADRMAENTTAVQALEKGFDDLIDLCDIVDEKFRDAKEEFGNRMEA